MAKISAAAAVLLHSFSIERIALGKFPRLPQSQEWQSALCTCTSVQWSQKAATMRLTYMPTVYIRPTWYSTCRADLPHAVQLVTLSGEIQDYSITVPSTTAVVHFHSDQSFPSWPGVNEGQRNKKGSETHNVPHRVECDVLR